MLIMKTQFQYVSISLLLKMEAVGLIVPCTSSCVINHVLNVLFCPFPTLLVFMSMITTARLHYTLNPLTLSCRSSCMNLLVCVLPAGCSCSAWMLHLLQFDCFGENVFPGISAESLSACIIMHRLIPLLPDY